VLTDELPDLVVPLAVLADAVGIADMMGAGLEKARADVARGVRNGNDTYATPLNVLQVADPAMGSGAFLGNPPYEQRA